MKIISFICFSFFLLTGFSQKDREKILASFDFIDYYPDSTIKEVRKFSGINLEGTTVEFNAIGKPIAIGNYKKGKKIGSWIYFDGSSDFFPEPAPDSDLQIVLTENYDSYGNKTGGMIPGCGTGKSLAIREFYTRYDALLNPENNRKFSCWGQSH